MPKLSFNSDLHVHTNISPCGVRDAVPQSYLTQCAEAGLDTVGFSNHFWDSAIPGADGWYVPLDIPHLMQIRDQIGDTYGVRVLIGCEMEFAGKLALAKENAHNFDYVLVSTSHFHQSELMEGLKTATVDDLRLILLERFLLAVGEASELSVPASLAHIFHPLGFFEYELEIMEGITDRMYEECFSFAAHKGVGIEIHLPTFRASENRGEDGLPRHAARMIRLAVKSGCRFTIGSDEHNPASFIEKNREIHEVARKLGVTPEMMMDI